MNASTSKLEVLAPAGSFESVVAAVQSGADAVYLGQTDFSARQNATNFTAIELTDAVCYCHARKVLVYQAINTIVFDSQLEAVVSCIKAGCKAGVDAFIVQDLAVLSIIKAICPTMPVHASTQMSVHTVLGAQELLNLGFCRVVLARELSFEQIRLITSSVDIETEVFVHGALCMSVSGQCYISAMIGTRSGNRGSCAGTCRLPFSSTTAQSHDLSLKDLCLVDELDSLKKIGVSSVKIEGRMKRGEYVAAASQVYSNALKAIDYDLDTLQAVFSRGGFTDGYYKNNIGADMFGTRQREDVILATDKLLKSIKNEYKKEKGRFPLHFKLTMKSDESVILSGHDDDGHCAKSVGEAPPCAINREFTREDALQALSKLGGTIFVPGEILTDIDTGLAYPLSKLNLMRREICESIMAQREAVTSVECLEYVNEPDIDEVCEAFSLRARFEQFSQIPFERLCEFSYFSLPLDEVKRHTAQLLPYKDKLLIEPDRFMAMTEVGIIKQLSELKTAGFTGLLCNNIAHIKLCRDLGFTCFGGAYLNCANSLALEQYKELSVKDQTLSFELNLATARDIIPCIPCGLIIYGYLPLMLLRNCPIKNQFSCASCDGKKSLTDRMGMSFRIICRDKKYSELLNCKPLYLADRLGEVSSFSFGVLYFTVEDENEVIRVIRDYKNNSPASGEFTRGLYYR